MDATFEYMFVRYAGHYLIADLEKTRLSVNTITKFNDPFELHLMQGDTLTPESARAMLERMIAGSATFRSGLVNNWPEIENLTYRGLPGHVREAVTKNAFDTEKKNLSDARKRVVEAYEKHSRVMCLCELKDNNASELLMWSYYSDGHQGVRLHLAHEFLFQKGHSVIKIKYEDTPPKVHSHLHPLVDKAEYDPIMSDIFSTKSKVWAHENETRLLVHVRKCKIEDDVNGQSREFLHVNPSDVVRIDLGCKYEKSFVQVVQLKKTYPNLDIYKAHRREDSYALSYEQVA